MRPIHQPDVVRRFLSPRELKLRLEQAAATVSPADFVRTPANQQLKETWCAAHFGVGYERHVQPCSLSVDLEQYSDTDFVLRTKGGDFQFQTTLSDDPERRMDDDYELRPDRNLHVRPYKPARGTLEGPKWIADAVRKKAERNYSESSDLNLLVYANFPTNGLDYVAVCSALSLFVGTFASIRIVTNHLICSVASFAVLGEISACA